MAIKPGFYLISLQGKEYFAKEGQEYTPCTTHITFGLKIYAALEVNSWYLSVQIKYTWRLVGMNAYMISCAPINLYLLIK